MSVRLKTHKKVNVTLQSLKIQKKKRPESVLGYPLPIIPSGIRNELLFHLVMFLLNLVLKSTISMLSTFRSLYLGRGSEYS